MKSYRKLVAVAAFLGFSNLAWPANLTNDPLTGLPLIPATKPRFGDNEPTKMPDSQICKSLVQANFYSVSDSKVSATLNWYASRLTGFQKTHGFSSGRSQDAFYSTDGTTVVSVTGEAGKDGEDTDTYAVSYTKFKPGLPAKTIIGINQHNIVCN